MGRCSTGTYPNGRIASWQALTGSSLQVIGKSLGHKDVATTQVYARLTVEPVRASMDNATNAMLEAANGKGESDGEA